MARPVAPRASFNADIINLYRLKSAIEVDASLPPAYRDELLACVLGLIHVLGRRDTEAKVSP